LFTPCRSCFRSSPPRSSSLAIEERWEWPAAEWTRSSRPACPHPSVYRAAAAWLAPRLLDRQDNASSADASTGGARAHFARVPHACPRSPACQVLRPAAPCGCTGVAGPQATAEGVSQALSHRRPLLSMRRRPPLAAATAPPHAPSARLLLKPSHPSASRGRAQRCAHGSREPSAVACAALQDTDAVYGRSAL